MTPEQKNHSISKYYTYPELLLYRADDHPDKTAIISLDEHGDEKKKINYRDLILLSTWYAQAMAKSYKKGDRCLIMMPAGIEFVIGYLACLFSGIIAVPVNIPRRNKVNKRFRAIFDDSTPKLVMLDANTSRLMNKHFKGDDKLSKARKVLINDLPTTNLTNNFKPKIHPEDIAYLQYTSGSTGEPKGVMVSQRNLIKNSEVITESFRHEHNLVLLNWLPPFHDMGLVGNLMQPLFNGGTSVVLQSLDFLKDPSIWFKAVTKYQATTTGCPNFALDYCVEKISDEQKQKIDLSSLSVFYCGSEPIRKESFENFSKAFVTCGFKEKMFLPCYGLAESTLMTTGIDAAEEPTSLRLDKAALENGRIQLCKNGSDFVEMFACGKPWDDNEILIADPESEKKLHEDEIGEILVKGSSVGMGYWNDPEETESVFKTYIGHPAKGPFLRTGDLGFIHRGNLYITGRKKDLIIIRGTNHYPQLLESTSETSHEALQSNACAAFSVDIGNEERLVIVQEVKRTHLRNMDADEVFDAIRSAIGEEHEISPHAISLISPGSMPKTTSGKIKRRECKYAWIRKELRSIDGWEEELKEKALEETDTSIDNLSIAGLRKWLINWLARKTNTDPQSIDPSKPIMSYGLDSISLVELEREVTRKFGIEISLADFMENNNINRLSEIGLNEQKKN